MRKIAILVVVLLVLGAFVGGLAYADLRLRGLAEAHAEQELAKVLPQAQGVHVQLDGFPFTPGVLLHGQVEALHVRIDVVKEAGLEARDLTLDVYAISLDEGALLDDQRLVVTDIGRATAQGLVGDEAVSRVVGREVRFLPGKARGVWKGHEVEVTASVKGRLIRLSAGIPGVPAVTFPLPPGDVLPCQPELELLEGAIRLSCTIDELPAALKDALARG